MGRGGTVTERFWVKVSFTDDCWEWVGSRTKDGYGSFALDGSRPMLAHRASHLMHIGEIPAGMSVLHRCDNPPCIRPTHLFLGTQADNIRDMDRKGRRNTDPRPKPNPLMGEQNPQHKLTWGQVHQIRAAFAAGASKRGLSLQFGVSRPVIAGIVEGRSWVALHGTLGDGGEVV